MCRVRVRVRVAHEHLVDEDAQSPPVDAEAVPFVRDDLGREILGRAAERPRALLDDLSEADVDHLQVPVAVQ